jgi:hypothetical protein
LGDDDPAGGTANPETVAPRDEEEAVQE